MWNSDESHFFGAGWTTIAKELIKTVSGSEKEIESLSFLMNCHDSFASDQRQSGSGDGADLLIRLPPRLA